MSDEGRTFVKLYSPFTGSSFWVHYVLGDMANVQHAYEIFWGDEALAREWRALSLRTISRARSELIEAGFLTVIDDRSSPGHVRKYRFEFLGHEEMRKPTVAKMAGVKPRTVAKMADERSPNLQQRSPNLQSRPYIELKEPKEKLNTRDPFDDFWSVYPLHKEKIKARAAFAKALKIATMEEIIAGAERYRLEKTDADPHFIKHPATWLNAGCWEDETPVAPARGLGQFLDARS